MKKSILALCAFLLLFAGFAKSGDTAPKDFESFWKKLHTAIIKKDYTTISQFVEFPLVVEIRKNDSNVQTVKADGFREFFNDYLSRPSDDMTRYEALRAKKQLSEEDLTLINDGSATIDDMEFQKIGGHWKLVYIYAE
ncbi:hypothetical protein MKQ68_23245 [Chitinophaga horti]|uniref:DUF4348 domain-containing protein n=1 Tax=Chitinophaga horti TaxID=2920382 RepID=A0ABY6J049_9BACT|nr:hypothetical protein [Chitinophaga horti]UYQ93000.1 hypothetical protein MKQ68_23245 [Chitinophaga horti]